MGIVKPSNIYFIRPIGQAGPVKIGCSEMPTDRLSALMCWSPFPLEIVATIPGDLRLERRIHGVFAEQHSHREWFHASKRLTNLITQLAAGAALAELLDLTGPVLPFRTRTVSYNYTPDRRLWLSYSARLRWAYKGIVGKRAPDDAENILGRWSGYHRIPAQKPTPEEFARLEEVLANPEQHGVPRAPRWQQAA